MSNGVNGYYNQIGDEGDGYNQSLTMGSFRDRDTMYKLIISQLFYDGQAALAKSIAGFAKINEMCPPSDRLFSIITKSLNSDSDFTTTKRDSKYQNSGIDLDFESERSGSALVPSQYETVYVTSHKGPCRAGAFSPDGSLVATGSVDASIKILDVERMIAKSADGPHDSTNNTNTYERMTDAHPVIRTLYDHVEEVSALAFHPKEQFLASGSHDMTIKLFDYSKPSVKRAFKCVQETSEVRALAFHPSGEYLLVGTQHPTIRMYHLPTFQSFISPICNDQHKSAIATISYNHASNLYCSASKDGDIRIWDTISNRCVTVYPRAHDGLEVCSAIFSRNGKYILSSGKDSMVKLWELSMSRCLIAYTGAGGQGTQLHRAQAEFSHTEDYVMMPDERSTSLCAWDTRNAERQQLMSLGHNNAIRHFAHSSTMPAFLTCSDDYRARFWYHRSTEYDL
ncbi:cleavage stimulation factor, 3' pre-RNA, subunit 1 [Blomia tropicalis]|nr:cleavage stimulation factor, 3' pre-RNA, subunit 1 [Blomia tropicalis]